MASKVSEKDLLTSVRSNDHFYIIRKVAGVWSHYRGSAYTLFKKVPANTEIMGTFTANSSSRFVGPATFVANTSMQRASARDLVVANTLQLGPRATPANSAITIGQGRLLYDNDYLYIATANNALKRVPLSSF